MGTMITRSSPPQAPPPREATPREPTPPNAHKAGTHTHTQSTAHPPATGAQHKAQQPDHQPESKVSGQQAMLLPLA